METILVVSLVALSLSLAANAMQAKRYRESKKKPVPTTSAEDLLHDLTRRGFAVLRVEVVDPDNLFLRSPRA